MLNVHFSYVSLESKILDLFFFTRFLVNSQSFQKFYIPQRIELSIYMRMKVINLKKKYILFEMSLGNRMNENQPTVLKLV